MRTCGVDDPAPTWKRKLAASLLAPLVAGPACSVPASPFFLSPIFLPFSMAVGYVWAVAPTVFFGLLGDHLVRLDRAWNSRPRWAATGAIIGFAVAVVGEIADPTPSFGWLVVLQLISGFTAAGAVVAVLRHTIVYRMGPARRR